MPTRSRHAWLPAITLAVLVPVFAALGIWQWHRADDKRELQTQYDRRSSEAPVSLDPALQSAEALRFHRLIALGKYDPEYQILLDNRVHHGVAGYYVLTPLRLDGGDTRVLVNRGWVPLGESRAKLPSIDTPDERVEVTGIATVPLERSFMLGTPAPGWQPVWSHLDMKRYAASVPFAVQPVVILLDPSAANGFARDWARLDAGIAVHQGYAFQWFALAVLSAVIFIVMLSHRPVRKRKKKR